LVGGAIKDRAIGLFGRGEVTRERVYIEGVSRLIALCLLYRSTGVINAVSGTALTFDELALMIAKIVGPDVKIAYLPRKAPITHRHFDVTERLVAFPSYVSTPLDEGLKASFLQLTALRQG